ncbi:hypothetical protein [Vibrio spartinae]|uniref:Lipoprotein n=1 Tax=Vibrio spartinae TaxID=1918945 RepID=A0A1N6M6I8_9VIBR|nr:hypothetical protein [Vibrio spartinae]QMV14248.1 hypothetical protein Vspart_01502 [Vibrio spartinae]SIO95058.1 hypothetical protein VSP9026_02797 [Vibrio spartinae]
MREKMGTLKLGLKSFVMAGLAILLAACSSTPQPTVTLDTNFVNEHLKVGVLYIPPQEEATTHIFGASCLLCYGFASTLTSELDTYLEKNITTDELIKIRDLVLSEYSQRSQETKLVSLPSSIKDLKDFNGDLGFAKKDFRSLKEILDIDVLVVLHITRYGAFRSFSDYIPNGDPQGYVAGLLYSVDLNSNAYVQYLDITEVVQPSGEWDEPKEFPSVTTSYYQAIENVKQKIKDAI